MYFSLFIMHIDTKILILLFSSLSNNMHLLLTPLRSLKREFRPTRVELPKIQKLIFSSASEMLASNDDLRKSITFLTPGVKLVVKTFPSESFSRIEQLKSFDAVWKRSSSLRV